MDSLRNRIASAVDDFYIYDPCWHPDDWKVAVANAVVEALGLTRFDAPPEYWYSTTIWTTDEP